MGTFERGQVITVAFPFSDLSSSKLRPALILSEAGRGDWLLCQITSQAFGDATAIAVQADEVTGAGLQIQSYIRPLKLFTANENIMRSSRGKLNAQVHSRVVQTLVNALS